MCSLCITGFDTKTAVSYGLSFTDEYSLIFLSEKLCFTHGQERGCYLTFINLNSSILNLFARNYIESVSIFSLLGKRDFGTSEDQNITISG